MTHRSIDEFIYKRLFNDELNVREVHTCPKCGWETDNLERSNRCQACWANGDRVAMGDKELIYDFHPSLDVKDALTVIEKFFSYQIRKLTNHYGYEVTLWDEYSLSITRSDHSLPMAICKAAMSYDNRC